MTDIVLADHILSELRRAMAAEPAKRLEILKPLPIKIRNVGRANDTIDNRRNEALLAVQNVCHHVEQSNGTCPENIWNKAIDLTKRWRALLI